ncbi:uncharacterized protein LOC125769496 [Anopheles funestus]|uniref:uncharacterized protein LOC125769496 n=1 Tax=Anopheles funestus TaxID=62324 RepID=UPI0020C7251F|nr:uncharacterized protein LOC125769496 [Anopheles funestus]
MTNEGAGGRSTMHGSSYHLRIAMVILLRAFTLRRRGALSDFKITMEDSTAGKFDDVVFHYSLPSTPNNFAYVYIQAKHKLNSTKNVQLIKEGNLFTKWNSNKPFSIPMYFISYLDGYEHSLNGSHTYILCTNASIDENLKKYLSPREHDSAHIFSFCDELGAKCYSLESQTEFNALIDELRNASVEKLGQMLAIHAVKKKLIKCSTAIFNVHDNLIAKCIKPHDSGIFQFNHGFWTAERSTLLGKLRNSFKQEYFKLTPNQGKLNKQVQWEEIRIILDQGFAETVLNLTTRLSPDVNSYYEKVDVAIQRFREKFLLVCGSMNETELRNKIMKMMPTWVNNPKGTYDALHNMLFDGMIKTVHISLQDLNQHFIETKANENFVKVQTFTNDYLKSMCVKYSRIVIEPNCLNETALNEFISCTTQYVSRYRCTTSMKLNILIVSQTLALHQYQCLFVDNASSEFKENIYDVLDELTEFIAAVGLCTEYIITILGQLGREVLRAAKNLARTREIKIIIIEEPAEEDPSEDCSFVRDLTNEAKKQIFEQHNLKLFGTTIALNNIVRETDCLSMLFNVLEKYDDTDVRESDNFNLQNFEKIKPWYIPRSFVPYSEENREAEQFLTEDEITPSLLKSVLPLKDQACNLPDVLKCEDNVKVHIFLDEAGYGKTTYFTWLASAISNDNSSMFVVRMNALQYSSDFFYLQALDPKTLDDTEVVRILYRLLHLTLFVCNIHNRAVTDFDKEREKAERTAKLLTFSDGKINLDETNPDVSKLPLQELLELRLFQNKFNENKFICLLDGFDEIVPHYKDFVMKYFARLSNFEGIRNLYISTRPYNFIDELKQTFSVGKLWRLEPFSQRDRIVFLNNYVEHELEGYKNIYKNLK